MMNDECMWCRCYGVDRRTRCENDATQEDGYCDRCRCPHGSCDKHGNDETYRSDLWYKEPMVWMDWFMQATEEMIRCRGLREVEDELRDESDVQDEEGAS